jgi:hypothetical protein
MQESPASAPIEARIIDFKMPFWSMVVFLVQVAIAAIPAMIILAIIGGLIFAVAGGIGATLMHREPTHAEAIWSPPPAEKQEGAPSAKAHAISDARYAAVGRCERAFSPGDAQMRCVTRESDCLRKYGEHPDSDSAKAAAEISCFEAVEP